MTPEQWTKTHLPGAPRVSSIEKMSATIARKSWAFAAGGVVGAFLVASVGVSAHTGALPILQTASVHRSHSDDHASVARTEHKDSTHAAPTAKPTEKPEVEPTHKPELKPTPKATLTPRATPTPKTWSKPEGTPSPSGSGGFDE